MSTGRGDETPVNRSQVSTARVNRFHDTDKPSTGPAYSPASRPTSWPRRNPVNRSVSSSGSTPPVNRLSRSVSPSATSSTGPGLTFASTGPAVSCPTPAPEKESKRTATESARRQPVRQPTQSQPAQSLTRPSRPRPKSDFSSTGSPPDAAGGHSVPPETHLSRQQGPGASTPAPAPNHRRPHAVPSDAPPDGTRCCAAAAPGPT